MNKFILLSATSLLAMSNVAYAVEGMRLDSLMFRPAKQQVVSVTTISQDDTRYKLLDLNTQQYQTTKSKAHSISNLFDYGVTKNFNIFAIIEYETTQTKYADIGTAKSQGLQNPIFALKYRFLNQDVEGVNFDISVPFSFDLMKSKRANISTDTKGTVADGRDTYALRLDLGKYIGDFGFALSAEGKHYTDTKASQQDGTYLRYSSSNRFLYAAEGQYRFNYGSVSLSASKSQYSSFHDGSNNQYSYRDSTSYAARLNLSDNPKKYAVELKLKRDYFGDTIFNGYLWLKNTVADSVSMSFRYSF